MRTISNEKTVLHSSSKAELIKASAFMLSLALVIATLLYSSFAGANIVTQEALENTNIKVTYICLEEHCKIFDN